MFDVMEYEHYTLLECSSILPLQVFEAQPVVGKRIIDLNLRIDDADKVSLIITGNTWPFREGLDAFSISGGYLGNDTEEETNMIDSSGSEEDFVCQLCGADPFEEPEEENPDQVAYVEYDEDDCAIVYATEEIIDLISPQEFGALLGTP